MKTPTLRIAITSLALAAQLFSSGLALGSEAIGTLGSIIGKASVVRNGKTIPVTKGMEVFATDELQTGPKTAVKILFNDGGNFMAFEDSKVKISEYKFKTNGKDSSLTSAFDVAKGKVRFFVKPEPGRKNDTKFKTSNAVMGIRGTSGFIDATKPGQTQLVVLTGKVEVSNPKVPGQSVMVPPNQMTSVVGTRAPTAPKAAPAALMGSLNAQANRVDPRPDAAPASEGARPASGEQKGEGEKRDPNAPAGDGKGKGGNDASGQSPSGAGPSGGAPSGEPAGGSTTPSATPESGAAPAPNADGAAAASPAPGAAPLDGPAEGSPSAAVPGGEGAPAAASPSAAGAPPPAAASSAPPSGDAAAAKPTSLTMEKKNVFAPDGQASIVVNDPKLTAITAPTSVGAAAAAQASAAVREAQTSSQVVKAVNQVVKTNTDKAIVVSTQAVAPKPVAAEAPKTKSVKVKVVLPPAP